MLLLFLAGCVAASGIAPSPEDSVAATPHQGGFSSGYNFGVSAVRPRRGELGVTRFKDGKPVVEPVEVQPVPEPVAAPEPVVVPPPRPGVDALGVGGISEAPASQPLLPLDGSPVPERPKAVKALARTTGQPASEVGMVMVGDGDREAVAIASLMFGFTLGTNPSEDIGYDEP